MKLSIQKSYWQQDIKKSEYAVAIGRGIAIILSIAYLFYQSFYVVILLIPYLPYFFKSWKKDCIKKKKEEFQIQFKDSMQLLSAALGVGYSVENSLRETAKELRILYKENMRIIKEFDYMVNQINMNMPAEKVLEEFSNRVEQEDVQSFVTVFIISKRAGGDSISIIKNTIQKICDKIEVKREIKTIMAAKRMEFNVMTTIPFTIILYMRFSFSEFMKVLYGNGMGIGIMTTCLALYLIAYQMGKKIIEIEV